VVPHVVVAFDPAGDIGLYLYGSEAPLDFEPTAVRGVLERPGVLEDLAESPDAPVVTLDEWAALVPRLVWLTGGAVRDFAGAGPLITDDRPRTEYFLLRRTFAADSLPAYRANLEALGER
jgi:hypothetical protein